MIEACGGLCFIDNSNSSVDNSIECKIEVDNVQDHISISSKDHNECPLSRATPLLKTEDPDKPSRTPIYNE